MTYIFFNLINFKGGDNNFIENPKNPKTQNYTLFPTFSSMEKIHLPTTRMVAYCPYNISYNV